MYQCDEFQHFIMECINLMENGSPHEIATTVTKFLKMLVSICVNTFHI